MNLDQFKSEYQDTEFHHKYISDLFISLTNSYIELKELRNFVESNIFGFGEREFYYMHKMIVESLDNNINFVEIGVFRGQILALYRILSKLCNKNISITGITPLDSTDGHWESDYNKDIKVLHDKFNLEYPYIIKGLSTDEKIIPLVNKIDILFIDGGHSYEVVKSDFLNYSLKVNIGGYMIADDSANNIQGCYDGRFWGIQDVSSAVDEFLPPKTKNDKWEYIGNVIHNRIWKKIK